MHVLVIGDVHIGKDKLIGIFQFDQAKALTSANVKVTYFALDLRSVRRPRRLGYSCGKSDGLDWHMLSLPVGRVPSKLFDAVGYKALLWLYRKVFYTTKPDIIHAHFLDKGVIASRLSKRIGVPLVITEHSSDMNKAILDRNTIQRAKEAYAGAKYLICVSAELSKNIKRLIGIDSIVIPNIIDIDIFSNSNRSVHQGFRIATTAGLVPGKRIQYLLQAIIDVTEIRDIQLDIVGDGPLRKELESFVVKNGISDKVTFHRILDREETKHIYETADCFALVSARETFGVVYVEAMAVGLPVIATRCGGPEDFVNQDNGILIDVDDQEQLDRAIRFMYENSKYYDGEKIKKWVKTHFAPSVVAEQLINIYSEIINL